MSNLHRHHIGESHSIMCALRIEAFNPLLLIAVCLQFYVVHC